MTVKQFRVLTARRRSLRVFDGLAEGMSQERFRGALDSVREQVGRALYAIVQIGLAGELWIWGLFSMDGCAIRGALPL
jgi:hypothetical protein